MSRDDTRAVVLAAAEGLLSRGEVVKARVLNPCTRRVVDGFVQHTPTGFRTLILTVRDDAEPRVTP